jgi:hypothetical protein
LIQKAKLIFKAVGDTTGQASAYELKSVISVAARLQNEIESFAITAAMPTEEGKVAQIELYQRLNESSATFQLLSALTDQIIAADIRETTTMMQGQTTIGTTLYRFCQTISPSGNQMNVEQMALELVKENERLSESLNHAAMLVKDRTVFHSIRQMQKQVTGSIKDVILAGKAAAATPGDAALQGHFKAVLGRFETVVKSIENTISSDESTFDVERMIQADSMFCFRFRIDISIGDANAHGQLQEGARTH